MGRSDYLRLGDYNAICYRCGFKFFASDLRREWEGFYVCEKCWEPRHPQDFVRGVQDVQTVPWSQPWTNTDTFVKFCSIDDQSAIPGIAIPGCMIPGNTRTSRNT